MTDAELSAIVAVRYPGLRDRLGLGRWTIRFGCDELAPRDGMTVRAECDRVLDYQDATITLDPAAFERTAEVDRVLVHELLHVVLAPLDLYRDAVQRLDLEPGERAILERVWEHALERTVAALDRMYQGLTAGAADRDRARIPPASGS